MIVIIDNYDSFTFNLYQLVVELEQSVLVFRNDKVDIGELEDLKPAAVILSPGPGRPENAGVCVPLIKQMYKKIPILGVCLGHQAIAYAFGAKIIHAAQIVHGKNSLIFHSREGIYKNMSLPFKAGRYHSLTIAGNSIPKELTVEAESANGEVMGIKHQEYPLYGVQFHPESILTPDGKIILANFIKEVV